MFQGDAITWDPIYINRPVSPTTRIYVLFLLVALLVMAVRLIALWIAAPPFRLSRHTANEGYTRRLEEGRSSILQWLGCIILGWCVTFSIDAARACERILEAKIPSPYPAVGAIQELSMLTSVAFSVAFLLFLAQWHLLLRLQFLRRQQRNLVSS